MDPIFFVFAWLAYVAAFWLALLYAFDADQDALSTRQPNGGGEILTRSLRARL
jgi:hypothetical protein